MLRRAATNKLSYGKCWIVGQKAEQVMFPITLYSFWLVFMSIRVLKQQVLKRSYFKCYQHTVSAFNSSVKQIFCCEGNFEKTPKIREVAMNTKESLFSWRLYSSLLLMSGWVFVTRSTPSYSWIERCFVLSSWTPCRLRTQHCDGRPPPDNNSSRGPSVDTHPAVVAQCPCMRRDLVQGNTPTGSRRPGMRMESFYNPSQPM